jgi:hypothetical protein
MSLIHLPPGRWRGGTLQANKSSRRHSHSLNNGPISRVLTGGEGRGGGGRTGRKRRRRRLNRRRRRRRIGAETGLVLLRAQAKRGNGRRGHDGVGGGVLVHGGVVRGGGVGVGGGGGDGGDGGDGGHDGAGVHATG